MAYKYRGSEGSPYPVDVAVFYKNSVNRVFSLSFKKKYYLSQLSTLYQLFNIHSLIEYASQYS